MPDPLEPRAIRRFAMLYIVPFLVLGLIRALNSTWRIRETGRERFDDAVAAPEPAIGAFLHGRIFALIRNMTKTTDGKWVSMCSKSLDGDAMTQVQESLGLKVVRGSSGRDGLEAIQEMIQMIRSQPGMGAALAVDGSRGPRGHVQGGVVRMARWTGGQILPMAASAKFAWTIKGSWDRTLLPLPFARVEIVYGTAIKVPKKLNPEIIERIRLQAEESLLDLQRTANALAGANSAEPIQAAV